MSNVETRSLTCDSLVKKKASGNSTRLIQAELGTPQGKY